MFRSTVGSAAAAFLLLSGSVHADTSRTGACSGQEQPTSRLFLQQVTDSGAVVKWRGPADAVCVGTSMERLTIRAEAIDEGHHKLARFGGLEPDTTYFYSVGGAGSGSPERYFRTAPAPGELPADGNVRLWLLGDSGTAVEADEDGELEHPGEALAVKAGYLEYVHTRGGNEPAELILLLGDNAYPAGTDEEWQGAYFDIYSKLIATTPTVPTIGNHEMGTGLLDMCPFYFVPGCEKGPVLYPQGGSSASPDPMSYDSDGDGPDGTGLPYLNIFTLPARGEQGGVPSGTEQYYSLDYGPVHVVSLDSQLSTQDPERMRAMRDWLVDDLSANALDWTVVIFHHPPYSKGKNHDSDLEQREIDMRQVFNPVFEKYGVDVVYSGHSHSYERSWYLGGHYGMSSTFDLRAHAEVDALGNPTLGQDGDPYPQVSASSGEDDKAVYTVAGSSGKTGGEDPPCEGENYMGCTMPDWLEHPAHRTFEKLADDYRPHGIERLGSVVLDAGAERLVSRFVDDEGEVLDYFVIHK